MKLVPLQSKTMLIMPFLGSGYTRTGLFVNFDSRYPPILARVLATSLDCGVVRARDVVVYRPHAYEEALTNLGTISVLSESAVTGIIQGFDEVFTDKEN